MARTSLRGSRPAAAPAARTPPRSQPRLSPAPQDPELRAQQRCQGCARVAMETGPPTRAVALQRDLRPRASRAEDWGGEVIGAIFELVKAPPPPPYPGKRDKLFFPEDATSITSLGYTIPRRGTLGVYAATSEGGGKCGSGAPVPGSKMARSGPAQRRGQEAAAAGGWRLTGPAVAGLAGQPGPPSTAENRAAPLGGHLEAKRSTSHPVSAPIEW